MSLIRNTLRDAASRYWNNRDMPLAFRQALHRVEEAPDAPGAAVALMEAIVLIEDVEALAKKASDDLREVMALTLAELPGKVVVENDHHTAYLSRAPQRVLVKDASLVPPDFLRQPPPSPDLKAIKAALKDGQDVPGCSLSNGGAPVLNIKAKGAA